MKSHLVGRRNVAAGLPILGSDSDCALLFAMSILLPLLIATVGVARCFSASEVSQSTNSYLTTADRIHLKKILEPALTSDDVSLRLYAIAGYIDLGETLPAKQDTCAFLTKASEDAGRLTTEKAFHIASIWRIVGPCQPSPPSNVVKVLASALQKDGSGDAMELYYAVSGLSSLSEKLSPDKVGQVAKAVQNALRKDDNIRNLGYAFYIASELGTGGAFAFDRIEDAIVQADEVDGRYLQFEGGLSVTSLLTNGIFKLSNSLKKKPPLTHQQMVKMANYFLSRRSVQTPKGAAALLSALTTLANNEKLVCVTLVNQGVNISARQPYVIVRVCDIMGNPLKITFKVVANSTTKLGDDAVLASNINFQPSPTDKTLFSTNLMELKPERGFYKISVTAGSVTNTVTVKILCEVAVDQMEIGTVDADQTTQPKLTRVLFPENLSQKIEADSQQKLVMRFSLKDGSSKKSMRAHQAFVRLSSVSASSSVPTHPFHHNRGHEIIFVAEPDTSYLYKFDMPVATAASNFDYQSGDYKVELIVGDAVLSNPFQWTVATVSLKFPEPTWSEKADKAAFKYKSNVYTTKPEIKHMFREPEKRPPAFVSNLFTGLCLAPVLLLLALWAKLGVNISNFPFSISAVTFHLGLASIFALFGIFWLKLNMFVTLRYLLVLGVVTFLAGNKMLSHIAHKHKSR